MKNKVKMKNIAVEETTLNQVKKIAKLQGISNGKFVEFAADFFLKTGIDPTKDFSIVGDLKEHNKKFDSFWGFLKTQEKEYLHPLIKLVKELNQQQQKNDKDNIEKLLKQMNSTIDDSKNTVLEIKNTLLQRNKNELKLEQTIKEQACVIDLCLEIINLPVNMVGVVKDKKLQDELKIKLQKLV